MFDEDNDRKPAKETGLNPRNLEPLSVEELRTYITFLEDESARASHEIKRKEASRNAADSVFKFRVQDS